jgi:hypothetical protein
VPTYVLGTFYIHFCCYQGYDIPVSGEAHCSFLGGLTGSIGHPPHSSASPVELRLRVGPRALSGKKKELRVTGGEECCPSVRPERSKGEEAWGEKVEGIII